MFQLPSGLGVALVVTLLFSTAAGEATAQVARLPRPYQALFGTRSSPDRQRYLDLNLSGFGGYDDDVTASPGGSLDPRFSTSSPYYGGTIGLSYSTRQPRVSWAFNGESTIRQYTAQDDLSGSSHALGAGVSFQVARRTRIQIDQSARYTPFFQLQVIPGVFLPDLGEAPAQSFDFAVSTLTALAFDTRVGISHELSERTSVSVLGTYRWFDYRDENTGKTTEYAAGARLTRRLSRSASARMGYTHRRGGFSPTSSQFNAVTHDIDVGIDYNRPLSFSRRTTIGFSTGSSILESEGERTVRVLGSAGLNHEIGRSWLASASYRRDAGFVEGFSGPVLTDAVVGRLSGFLGRRVQLELGAGYSAGSRQTAEQEEFSTTYGLAGLTLGLTRTVALDVQYLYYFYRFDQGLVATLPLTDDVHRQSVRGGVSVWLPLLR